MTEFRLLSKFFSFCQNYIDLCAGLLTFFTGLFKIFEVSVFNYKKSQCEIVRILRSLSVFFL